MDCSRLGKNVKIKIGDTALLSESYSENFERKIFDPFYEEISNISSTYSHFESIKKNVTFFSQIR